jgi:hypothetical protein
MKTLILSILALASFAAPAARADIAQTIFSCRAVNAPMDAGLIVTIQTIPGSIGPGYPGNSTYVATVSRQSIAGPRPVRTVKVTQVPVLHRLGAPAIYKGREFKLSVQMMVSPSQGGYRGHVDFEVPRGGRFSEDLVCKLTR